MGQSASWESRNREEITSGLLPVNIGALLMPPIWGPAHGVWITVLYYPVWLLADNLFYGVYQNPTPLFVILSVVAFVILAVVTVVFARASQGYACQRALAQGKTKQEYRKHERIWAIAMGVLAVAMIAGATYYNLFLRASMGA